MRGCIDVKKKELIWIQRYSVQYEEYLKKKLSLGLLKKLTSVKLKQDKEKE